MIFRWGWVFVVSGIFSFLLALLGFFSLQQQSGLLVGFLYFLVGARAQKHVSGFGVSDSDGFPSFAFWVIF